MINGYHLNFNVPPYVGNDLPPHGTAEYYWVIGQYIDMAYKNYCRRARLNFYDVFESDASPLLSLMLEKKFKGKK